MTPRAVSIAFAAAALSAAGARAETADDDIALARAAHDHGDFARARDHLLRAYALDHRPELLFALGQIEFNLAHYDAAIGYYEQFINANPAVDQASLAQQAIGAARARLAMAPPPAPPTPRPPAPHRHWDAEDTGLAAFGGASIALGTALAVYGHHLGADRSGPLTAYADRLDQSRATQWAGAGCIAGGALAIGGAVLRWRLHLVDTEVRAAASATSASIALEHRW